MSWEIHTGDALAVLRTLPSNAVHCVVTSPPYWGLRDYGVAGQLGLEPKPEAYLDQMVQVFSEVRRVLRPDGTLWLNMGDSAATGAGAARIPGGSHFGKSQRLMDSGNYPASQPNRMPQRGLKEKDLVGMPWRLALALQADGWYLRSDIIWHKPSAMPESIRDRPTRVHEYLFLLSKRAHYFYDEVAILEPSSGTAHPRGHGVNPRAKLSGRNSRMFLSRDVEHSRRPRNRQNEDFSAALSGTAGLTRKARSVWTISTKPFLAEMCCACRHCYFGAERKQIRIESQANGDRDRVCLCGVRDQWLSHFATFPERLAERCLLAGTSERGACSWCGAPYRRVVERGFSGDWHPDPSVKAKGVGRIQAGAKSLLQPAQGRARRMVDNLAAARAAGGSHDQPFRDPVTLGWQPSCVCSLSTETVPCIVLDPFSGAATTGVAALRHGQDFWGIELNPDYVHLGNERLRRARAAREEQMA